jgi:flagellar secretion chaperone FliS
MTRMTAANPYQGSAVATATPAQLILMLFDGALTAIGRVRRAGSIGDVTTVNRELQRVQDIVAELEVSLDLERGHPIAGNLARLYEFCQHRLLDANLRKDLSLLDEVETVIQELRDGWDRVCVHAATLAAARAG